MADNTEKNFWQKFFTELLPLEQRIVLGTVLTLATLFLLGYQGLNEGARMAQFDAQWDARAIQRGAGLYQDSCSECHGVDGKGLTGIAPALNATDLFDGSRLEDYGYSGTVESYVELTIAAGRPAANPAYASPMPTWGQEYGGPFRPDQVRDLTSYILNYGCFYDGNCIDDAEAFDTEIASLDENNWWVAGSAAPVPDGCALADGSSDDPTGFDYAEIVANLPEGNVDCGRALFTELTCSACHSTDGSALVGPSLQGVKDRTPDGYDSIEQYLAESVWHPAGYVVDGFVDVMLKDLSTRMDDQNLADVIAYILSIE